jgi:hypothetical protein
MTERLTHGNGNFGATSGVGRSGGAALKSSSLADQGIGANIDAFSQDIQIGCHFSQLDLGVTV